MPSIVLDRDQLVVGVDTHKQEHVAVAVDGLGRRLGDVSIPATPTGYTAMLAWAEELGSVAAFGVEGTGSYGSGLARFLRRHGQLVVEVSRPPRRGERRLSGKSDPIDAEHAARAVLSGQASAVPKLGEGAVETIRLVKIARDSAVRAQSQAMQILKSILTPLPDALRGELEPLSDYKLITTAATLTGSCGSDSHATARHVLSALARRWLELHDEVKAAHQGAQGPDEGGGPGTR